MHIPMQFVHVLNSACGKVMEVRAKGGYSGHSVGKNFVQMHLRRPIQGQKNFETN